MINFLSQHASAHGETFHPDSPTGGSHNGRLVDAAILMQAWNWSVRYKAVGQSQYRDRRNSHIRIVRTQLGKILHHRTAQTAFLHSVLHSDNAAESLCHNAVEQFGVQRFEIPHIVHCRTHTLGFQLLGRGKRSVTLHIPYAQAGLMDLLQREAAVTDTEYTDEGIVARVVVPAALFGRVKDFIPGYVEPKEDWE